MDMNQDVEFNYWNEIKIKLKKEYSQLTNADLEWRYTSTDDLLTTIANNLGITLKEIREVLRT